MTKTISIDYLRAENLKDSTRAKHSLPKKGFVKAIVTRNSLATTSYIAVDMISEIHSKFENLKGKTL